MDIDPSIPLFIEVGFVLYDRILLLDAFKSFPLVLEVSSFFASSFKDASVNKGI